MGLKNRTLLLAFLVFISVGAVSANVEDLNLVDLSSDSSNTGTSNSMTSLSHAISPGTPLGVNMTVNNSQEMEYAVLDRNDNSQYDAGTDFISSKNITTTGMSVYLGNFSSSNTSLLSHGNYTVYGFQESTSVNDGYDLSGAMQIGLEVDNSTPKIGNYAFSDFNSTHFQVSFDSNETLGGIEVSVELNETQSEVFTDYETLGLSDFENSSLTYSAEFEKGDDGNYSTQLVVAEDRAGNNGASHENASIIYDTSGPYYENFGPSDLTQSSQPLISLDVKDLTDVDASTIQVGVEDSSGEKLSGATTSTTGVSYSGTNLTIDSSSAGFSLTEGDVNVSISADDSDGRSSSNVFSFKYDDNPPSIYGFNATNQSVDDIGVEFESLGELDVIRVTVRGPEDDLLNSNTFSETDKAVNFLYEATYTTSSDGNFTLGLGRAEDVYGNNREDYSIEDYVVKEEVTEVDSFSARNLSKDDIYLSFNSSEQLENVIVEVSGPEDTKLTENDFSTSDSSAPYNYSTTYKAGYDGTYDFELKHANDSYGGFTATDGVTTASVEVNKLLEIYDFSLYYSGSDIDLEINSSVQLEHIKAWVRSEDGSLNENRTENNFTETENGYWLYENDVADSSGTYNATLYRAEDSDGNDAANQQFDEIIVNTDSPQDPVDTKIEEHPNSYNEESLEVNTTFNSVPGDDVTLWLGATHEDGTVENSTFYFSSPSNNYLNASFDISSLPDGEITLWSRVEKGGTYNPSNYTASKTFVKDTDIPEIISGYTGGVGGNSSDTSQIALNVSDNGTGIDKSSVSALKIQVNSSENPDTPLVLEDVSYSSGKLIVDLMNELSSDETAELKLTGNITDKYDQPFNTSPVYSIQDGLSPLATSAVVNSSSSNSSHTVINVEFNENFTSNSASADIGGVSVNVSDVSSPKAYLQSSGVLETSGASLTGFSGVTDDAGNVAAPEGGSINVKSFKRKLVNGWNLVSFPIADGKSYSISSLIDTSKIETIWSYNSGEWHVYEPEAPSDFTSFRGSEGYLIKAKTDFTIAPQVDIRDDESTDTSMEIESGWNLVGHVEEYNQTADTNGAFSSLSSVNTVRAQTTDGDLSYGSTKYAVPGEAYWLDSGSSDTLTGGFAAEQPPNYFNTIGKIWNSLISLVSFE